MKEWSDWWGIESTHFHGQNVVSCEIFTGPTWTTLVGAYLPHSTLEDLPDVNEVLQQFNGRDPIVLGDLNMELENTRSSQSQRVADPLIEYGIIDLVQKFIQRQCFQYLKTWTQVKQGTVLRSRCYYILGTDWRRFKHVNIRDVHNYTSDQFAIQARLFKHPT